MIDFIFYAQPVIFFWNSPVRLYYPFVAIYEATVVFLDYLSSNGFIWYLNVSFAQRKSGMAVAKFLSQVFKYIKIFEFVPAFTTPEGVDLVFV